MRVGGRPWLHLTSSSLEAPAGHCPLPEYYQDHLGQKNFWDPRIPTATVLPQNPWWGLESQKLKITWWYLIGLHFFQILSCTSFQWPFPLLAICHCQREKGAKAEVGENKNKRMKKEYTRPFGLISSLTLCSCLFLLERGVKMAFWWRKKKPTKTNNQKTKLEQQTGNPEVVVRCLQVYVLFSVYSVLIPAARSSTVWKPHTFSWTSVSCLGTLSTITGKKN